MPASRVSRSRDVQKLRDRITSGVTSQHFYLVLLGLDSFDTSRLVDRISKGLPYRACERFQNNLQITGNQLATLLQIPLRTLSRRKEQGRLKPDESDRLIRASRIVGQAAELFEGDFEGARAWLDEPNPALGGVSPMEMSETEVGAREVEGLITRLEHGVFA